MRCKCQFPNGITIKPNGINPLDPCLYKRKVEHRNATVYLDQCVNCGHIEISWRTTEDTKTIVYEELELDERDNEENIVIQRRVDPDDYDEDDDIEEDDEWTENLD